MQPVADTQILLASSQRSQRHIFFEVIYSFVGEYEYEYIYIRTALVDQNLFALSHRLIMRRIVVVYTPNVAQWKVK